MRSNHRGFTLIELLIVVAIIGTIAAIAIPSLLRARIAANEARMIGDTRTVISASQAYAGANCGFFARSLRCMNHQSGICIPNYPTAAPEFLGADLAQANPHDRGGYRRRYRAQDRGGGNPQLCDPNSRLNFCYDGIPSSPGMTGIRAFNGMATGLIFVDPAGARIACPAPAGTATLE